MNSRVCLFHEFDIRYISQNVLPGQVIGSLNTRRGTIVDSEVRDDEFTAIAEVALNDMFGYSNALRGSTQGKGMSSSRCPVKHSFIDVVRL